MQRLPLLALLLAACQPPTSIDDARGTWQASSKSDQFATCAASCGGRSPGRCWCDHACTRWGDCCPDYQPVCGAPGDLGHGGKKASDLGGSTTASDLGGFDGSSTVFDLGSAASDLGASPFDLTTGTTPYDLGSSPTDLKTTTPPPSDLGSSPTDLKTTTPPPPSDLGASDLHGPV